MFLIIKVYPNRDWDDNLEAVCVAKNGEIICDEEGKEIKCIGLNKLYEYLKEDKVVSEELLKNINEKCKRE